MPNTDLHDRIARALHGARCQCGGKPWPLDFDGADAVLPLVVEAVNAERERARSEGFDAGVDAMRRDAKEWQDFEANLFDAAKKLGFTGVGLGKREAILQVFWFAAAIRTPEPTEEERND